MPTTWIFKNEDITSATLAVPKGHMHLRLAITTKDGETIVLQEAAVAAIVRAYTTVKTHPVKRAVKMVSANPVGLKDGYAADQLIEVNITDEDAAAEVSEILHNKL